MSVLFCNLFFIEMVDVKEQCVCVKFYFKPDKSVVETHKILKQAAGNML